MLIIYIIIVNIYSHYKTCKIGRLNFIAGCFKIFLCCIEVNLYKLCHKILSMQIVANVDRLTNLIEFTVKLLILLTFDYLGI